MKKRKQFMRQSTEENIIKLILEKNYLLYVEKYMNTIYRI